MQINTLIAILSVVASTFAIPLAEPELDHVHHNSTQHEQKSLLEVCQALQPNETQNLDLHQMTKLQIKCGQYFYVQAHHQNSTDHHSTKRTTNPYSGPNALVFGTMTKCDQKCMLFTLPFSHSD